MAAPASARDTLADIKQRGKLIVGVKTDYKPFGFLDPSGKVVGIEPDLAADVAKRLGVGIEYVPVVAANRIQFLQQGRIDLMIATMTDTPQREELVGIVKPSYYAAGVDIIARKASGLKKLGRSQRQVAVRHSGRVLQQRHAGQVRRDARRVSGNDRSTERTAHRNLRRFRL